MSRPNGQQESKSYQSSDPVNLDSDKKGSGEQIGIEVGNLDDQSRKSRL